VCDTRRFGPIEKQTLNSEPKMLHLVLESVQSLGRATLSTAARHAPPPSSTPRAGALGPPAQRVLESMAALHRACGSGSPTAQLDRAFDLVRAAEALLDAAEVPVAHPTYGALGDAGALIERLLEMPSSGQVRYVAQRCSTPPSVGLPTALAL
jgi:hypothetical protein